MNWNKKIINVTLKDALCNLSPSLSTEDKKEYNKGIVLGVVSTLMAQGATFRQAINVLANNLPPTYFEHFPISWAYEINEVRNEVNK